MTPGEAIPELERELALARLVAYAGATWDWHRLHYDRAYADPPVVDGPMLAGLVAEQVIDWLGPRAFVTELTIRFRAVVFAGETVRCVGEVESAASDGEVRTTHRVLVGDQVRAEATTAVRLG